MLIVPIARLFIENDRIEYINFICTILKIEDPYVCASALELYKVN